MTTTLLREHIGAVLRAERAAQGRTLRDVAAVACVSLGYLSEVERGEKEPSSETLAAVCGSLGVPLSVLLTTLAGRYAAAETLSSATVKTEGRVLTRLVVDTYTTPGKKVNPPWGHPVPAVSLADRVSRYQTRNVAAATAA